MLLKLTNILGIEYILNKVTVANEGLEGKYSNPRGQISDRRLKNDKELLKSFEEGENHKFF